MSPTKTQSEAVSWVRTSTVKSAAVGTVSVLAVTETLLFSAGGFYLWLHHDWLWHLLFGLLISPFFYLRTKESTTSALRWANHALKFAFENRETSWNEQRLMLLCVWLVLLFFAVMILALPLYAFGVEVFWIAIASGLAIAITIANAASVTGTVTIAASIVIIGALSLMVFITAPVALVFVDGSLVFQTNQVAPFLAFVMIIAVAGFWEVIVSAVLSVSKSLFTIVVISNIAIVIFVLMALIRIGVGSWYLISAPLESLRCIPRNWQYHNLALDSLHPPELLPNAEMSKDFIFRFSKLFNSVYDNNSQVKVFTIATILYFPAFLFRYSMKTGAWIWFPLIWLLRDQDSSDADRFLKAESSEFLAHLKLTYAMIIVVVLTLGAIVYASWMEQHGWHEQALSLIFLFGFTKLWTWTRLGSALLYLVSYIGSRHIRISRETRNEPMYGATSVTTLRYLYRMRIILAIYTIFASLWVVVAELVNWDLLKEGMSGFQVLPGFTL